MQQQIINVLFGSAEQFVQFKVEGIMENIAMWNYFKFEPVVQNLFKDFSIFSPGGHFVQQSRTICAILVEGIMGNIHVKLL